MKIEGELKDAVARVLRVTVGELDGELRQLQAMGARLVSRRKGVAGVLGKLGGEGGVELSEGEAATVMASVGRRPWVEVAGLMEGIQAVGMKSVGERDKGCRDEGCRGEGEGAGGEG